MVQKYQNEFSPIFYYGKKLKTSGKLQKIPDFTALWLRTTLLNDPVNCTKPKPLMLSVYCIPLGRGESAAGVARWPGQGPGDTQARPGAGHRPGGDREPGSVWGEGRVMFCQLSRFVRVDWKFRLLTLIPLHSKTELLLLLRTGRIGHWTFIHTAMLFITTLPLKDQ